MQASHPELLVVALCVSDDRTAIDKLITRQKLDALRVAPGLEWQAKFGLTEAIPATVVLERGRTRIIHESLLTDPELELEADLEAIHAEATPANPGVSK